MLVEDDRQHADVLALYLRRDGFSTVIAHDGAQALALARDQRLLCAVLDVTLPDMDGWDICRELRRFSQIPILFTSSMAQVHHKVRGLTLGADDYLVKPFSFQELAARIKAVLRRTPSEPDADLICRGEAILDVRGREIRHDGQAVALTVSECRILQLLMGCMGRVFTRRELVTRLYPSGGVVVDRVIDVHVAQLRKKLECDPSRPRHILTVRGVGYCYDDGTAHGRREAWAEAAVTRNDYARA